MVGTQCWGLMLTNAGANWSFAKRFTVLICNVNFCSALSRFIKYSFTHLGFQLKVANRQQSSARRSARRKMVQDQWSHVQGVWAGIFCKIMNRRLKAEIELRSVEWLAKWKNFPLSSVERAKLIALMNFPVRWDNKTAAFELMMGSLTRAPSSGDDHDSITFN